MTSRFWSIFMRDDPAAQAAHLDRNALQAHHLPDHLPDPRGEDAVTCVVDDDLTSWVADGRGFAVFNQAFGLHGDDAVSWRGYPAAPFLEQPPEGATTAYQADQLRADLQNVSVLSSPEMQTPGSYQAVYEGADLHLSPTSTYDAANSRVDVLEHFFDDVAPHIAFGGDYKAYDLSNGQDLSHVGRDDPAANVYPCVQGAFTGGDGFHGIDDPVGAGGQLHAASGHDTGPVIGGAGTDDTETFASPSGHGHDVAAGHDPVVDATADHDAGYGSDDGGVSYDPGGYDGDPGGGADAGPD